MFKILLGNKAQKEYRELDPKMQARVNEVLEILETNPKPYGLVRDLKKLKGTENEFRVRLSSHRLLYKIDYYRYEVWVSKIDKKTDNTYD